MAEKRTIELDVNTKEAEKSTQSLKSRLKELKEQIALAGDGTEEFKRLTKEAGALKDRIDDVNRQVKNFASDTRKLDVALEGVTAASGAFQAFEGSMALVGIESEDLQKTMVKLQAVMAVTNGVQSVANALNKDSALTFALNTAATNTATIAQAAYTTVVGASTGALKVFRIAMLSTGIGALVVGIGLLVANFDKLLGLFTPIIQGFKDFGDWIGITNFKQAEADKQAVKRADNRLKEIQKEKAAREKLFAVMERSYSVQDKEMNRQIALLKAQGKDTTDLERKRLKATISYQTNLQSETYQMYMQNKAKNQLILSELRAIAIREKDFTEYNAKLKEFTDSQNELAKENLAAKDARLDAINELAILDAEIAKQAIQNSRSTVQNTSKDQKEKLDLTRQNKDRELALMDEGIEKERSLAIEKAKREKEDLIASSKDKIVNKEQLSAAEKLIEDQLLVDLGKITDKYSEVEYNKEKEAKEKRLEEQKKSNEERIALEDEQYNMLEKLRNSKQQQELLELQQAFDDKMAKAVGNAELEQALTEQFGKDYNAVVKKYKDEEVAIEKAAANKIKEANQKRIDLILKYSKTFSDAMGSLNNLMNVNDNERLKKVEKGSKQEEAIKRKMFERDKKLRIVQTIIDTASNIVTSVRNGGGIPTGLPFGIAAAAMGGLQIAAISKAKFDSGNDQAPDAGGGGGGGSMVANFNTIGTSGINQLAQLQQQPMQAYVVSGEVTSAQALDRNRVQNATL
jgi:hypothetical protein